MSEAWRLGLDAMQCVEKLIRALNAYAKYCDRPHLYLNLAIAARVAGVLELVKLAEQAERLLEELGEEGAWARVAAKYISAALLVSRYEEQAKAWAKWLYALLSCSLKFGLLLLNFPGTGLREFDRDVRRVGGIVARGTLWCGAEVELIASLRVEDPPGVWGQVAREIARSQEEAASAARELDLVGYIRALIDAGAERAERMILNPQNQGEMRVRKTYLGYDFMANPRALEREALKLAKRLVQVDRTLETDTGWPTEDPLRALAALKTSSAALNYLRRIRELRLKPKPHF